MSLARRVSVLSAAVVTLSLAGTGAPALAGAGAPTPLSGVAAKEAAQHADPARRGAAAAQVTPADTGGGEQEGEGDALEVADQAEHYAGERSAPADDVSAQALLAARQQAAAVPQAAVTTSQLTTVPYQAEPTGYDDPVWSNAGAGFGVVSGRTTAVATRGTTYYAGTADGGVWKSTDAGTTWRSIWDGQPTLSIGSVAVGPTGDVWVGTGEANTSSDSYQGTGVYRSTDGGRTFTRVGGGELPTGGWSSATTAVSTAAQRHSPATDGGTASTRPRPRCAHGRGLWQLKLR